MKSIILFFLVIAIFLSCKTVPKSTHSLLKNTNKESVIITEMQADEIYEYFSLTIPKSWNRYFDSHNIVINSPLGKSSYNRIISDSIEKRRFIKNIYNYNKSHKNKKGNYWQCYLNVFSQNKDSIKVNNYTDIKEIFVKRNKVRFNVDLKYQEIREQNDTLGEIIYFKYGMESYGIKSTHLEAFILKNERLYSFNFQSNKEFYDFYINDVLNIIKSIKIKE
tara:strand:+ start:86 stop:748 length:663 start_codon:yes stop_codon:yes gene_type:complete